MVSGALRRGMGVTMQVEELHNRRGGDASAHHCLARGLCPLGAVCAQVEDGGRSALYPTVLAVEQGEIVWADQRFEQRVFVIQEGVFACIDNPERGDEAAFAIFGCGDSAGLAELYVDRGIASTYYLRALAVGRVCSLPAKALRHALEALPAARAHRMLGCAYLNSAGALFFQTRMMAKVKTGERIALLLARVDELLGREGRRLEGLTLSHGDIAALVGSDRVSTTRGLHRMEQDGLVELGYRSVRPTDAFRERTHLELAALEDFCTPSASGGEPVR